MNVSIHLLRVSRLEEFPQQSAPGIAPTIPQFGELCEIIDSPTQQSVHEMMIQTNGTSAAQRLDFYHILIDSVGTLMLKEL